ncbi:MAG: YabP/YqfC family sporulation protein [Clostridia bacterium]|nr:YabP/YqfC family sporulation protein [Clostridia bacterium]
MRKIRDMQNRVSERLKLPEDALGSAFRVQWIGDSVGITACKRICGYTSEKISVQTADGLLSVYGQNLKCLYFFASAMHIRGKIKKIEVEHCD